MRPCIHWFGVLPLVAFLACTPSGSNNPNPGGDTTPKTGWQALKSGLSGTAQALAVYKGELIAGGHFTSPGAHIARWNGADWQKLDTGTDSDVNALAVYNDELYAGGFFTTAGGVSASNIARWDGTAWKALGTGLTRIGEQPGAVCNALAVYNGELIVAGRFSAADGVSVKSIARWNGSQFAPLGGGIIDGPACFLNGPSCPTVDCLTVFGNELIAGGQIDNAGGVLVNRIARWNGSAWNDLGSGVMGGQPLCADGQECANVLSLATHNGALIAGGRFTKAGGVNAPYIASWNGSGWSPLGNIFTSDTHAIGEFNGNLISENFVMDGSTQTEQVLRWTGTAWESFGKPSAIVLAFTVYNGALIAAGDFYSVDTVSASYIASYVSPP